MLLNLLILCVYQENFNTLLPFHVPNDIKFTMSVALLLYETFNCFLKDIIVIYGYCTLCYSS